MRIGINKMNLDLSNILLYKIDRFVYEFYGLTEEEIKIVEES